jgi:hypothetical protein
MGAWTFRCYGSDNPCDWEAWFFAQSVAVQAKHDQVFDLLEQRPRTQWTPPYVKKLKGDKTAIWEVLVTKGVAWRIFGWFSGESEFTVTGIGNHKGRVYDPKDIIATSRRRRVNIESGKLEVKSCVRPKTPE